MKNVEAFVVVWRLCRGGLNVSIMLCKTPTCTPGHAAFALYGLARSWFAHFIHGQNTVRSVTRFSEFMPMLFDCTKTFMDKLHLRNLVTNLSVYLWNAPRFNTLIFAHPSQVGPPLLPGNKAQLLRKSAPTLSSRIVGMAGPAASPILRE